MVRRLYTPAYYQLILYCCCIYQDITPFWSVEKTQEMGNCGHNAATVSSNAFIPFSWNELIVEKNFSSDLVGDLAYVHKVLRNYYFAGDITLYHDTGLNTLFTALLHL